VVFGREMVALAAAHMPPHAHGTGSGQDYGFMAFNNPSFTVQNAVLTNGLSGSGMNNRPTTDNGPGSSTPFASQPPSVALNFIIKR
jgi:hypothetical protein